MKKRSSVKYSLTICILALVTAPVYAANKTIYIKPFAIIQGMELTDPAGNLIKDYISEFIIEKGGYLITSDDEVKQILSQEALRMSLDACYDDACIKKLMESIKTDYIIYGTISIIGDRYYITAKILDRSSGRIILSRVKTLKFANRDAVEYASKSLGEYLITGNDGVITRFKQEEQERERIERERKGLSAAVVGRRDKITTRAPLFRFGGGISLPGDRALNGFYNPGINMSLDIFPWRQRDSRGNGFDAQLRAFGKHLVVKSGKKGKFNQRSPLSGISGPVEPGISVPAFNSAYCMFIGGNAGGRYVHGIYFWGLLWQAYLSAAYQYVYLIENVRYDKILINNYNNWQFNMSSVLKKKQLNVHGVVGGVGLELGITPYFGIFVECGYGYCPAGPSNRNIAGLTGLFGMSIRTSFLD